MLSSARRDHTCRGFAVWRFPAAGSRNLDGRRSRRVALRSSRSRGGGDILYRRRLSLRDRHQGRLAYGREDRMRICWFNDNRLGLVEGAYVRDASKALEELPKPIYPFAPKGDPLIANLERLKPVILDAAQHAKSIPVGEVKF